MNIGIAATGYQVAKAYSPAKSETMATRERKSSAASNSSDSASTPQISQSAREMGLVRSAMERLPEIRIDLVEDIRLRIKTNDYPVHSKIDPAAKKLIQNAMEQSGDMTD